MVKLDLRNVTAICVDGRIMTQSSIDAYTSIVNFMRNKIDLGSIKILATENPSISGIEFSQINRLNITEYSKFCIYELYKYVETDYCLIFQDDGFIVNPNLWDYSFLNYDYIGAPWPSYLGWVGRIPMVGNGGFSLRSKKFMQLGSTLQGYFNQNEDAFLTINNKRFFETKGCVIAPVEVARNFSVENPMDENHNLNTTFGFHSKDLYYSALSKIENN